MANDLRYLTSARVAFAADEARTFRITFAKQGSVVFPKAGGAIATNKKRAVRVEGGIDLNCMAVAAGPEVDEDYLYWWFQQIDLASLSDGSILPQLSKKTICALNLPVPPLDEQRRIVGVLEDTLSRQERAEGALVRARALAASAWTAFLSRALNKAAESGVQRALGDVAATRLGKMLDAKRNTGAPTPYLRNQNVQWRFIDFNNVLEVPLSPSEVAELAVAAGDLLVCEGGEPGRCAVVKATPDRPVAFQKALHRVRANDGVSSHFLQLVLEALERRGALEPLFTGTTIKHLPQERLRALEVPVPSLDLQRVLVDSASTLRADLDSLLGDIDGAMARSTALRRSLLSNAFTGQLLKEPALV